MNGIHFVRGGPGIRGPDQRCFRDENEAQNFSMRLPLKLGSNGSGRQIADYGRPLTYPPRDDQSMLHIRVVCSKFFRNSGGIALK